MRHAFAHSLIVSLSLHHLLFVLLPLALAASAALKRPCDIREQTRGALRFCVSVVKVVLLVIPLAQLGMLVLNAGSADLSNSVAWVCVVAVTMSLAFASSALVDAVVGLRGLFGIESRLAILERRVARSRRLAAFLAASFPAMLLLGGTVDEVGHLVKTLVTSRQPTIAIWFNEARVWSNFHVVTLIGALAAFFGMPRSDDFLREWKPWKNKLCLTGFAVAAAVLWTRYTPMP